ncbi:sugar-binding transcriptional regulator [Propionicicella superfundia]|uniref:sugar-binding transcriptional regulator n=1 Tax=Propionicicella superfundia TaxID=348582 RepID=UPI0003F4AD4E|nr:sugar-binding domain-containing protein [Propionicicella superfundia]
MYITLARVSHMYYEQGMTQQQIADELNLSRMRVSRMLQQARAEGIVSITITYDGFFPHLERRLRALYPGTTFIVTDSLDGSDDGLKRSLGSATADYLQKVLTADSSVALGWGTTLREVARCLDDPMPGVRFIPLIGGQVHAGLDVHANSIAEAMAQNTGGSSMRIFAPAVAESAEARELLVSSAAVRGPLEEAAAADVCLFSVGSPFSPSTTIELVGYYTPADVETLRASGAACDLISISYFDHAGRNCCRELSDRTVSVSEDQLRAIPQKICVAGAADKHEAIKIALSLDLVDVMILDDASARYLVGEP